MQNLAFIQNQNEVARPKLIRASMLGAQDVRFMGAKKEGYFSFDGAEADECTEIEMQVIGFVPISCEDFYLFNEHFEKYDRFLEIIFLDGSHKLSTMFIKMESMGQFEKTLRAIDLDGKPYQSQIIKAKAAERTKPQPHFVLEFELVGPAPEDVTAELAEMVDAQSPYLMRASRFLNGSVKKIARENV